MLVRQDDHPLAAARAYIQHCKPTHPWLREVLSTMRAWGVDWLPAAALELKARPSLNRPRGLSACDGA